MKYTIKDLRKDFPNDEVCLNYIFAHKYPAVKGYHRVNKRKCWAHQSTGHQIHPLQGTIFEKSSTPLTTWFHVLFLFASSKNGVSAKEIQRQTGVTYKTAWRMGHQIRQLMEQGTDPLKGEVQIDETFYGKGGGHKDKAKNKQAVIGAVEHKGRVRAKSAPTRRAEVVLPFVQENVEKGAHIVTDEYAAYNRLSTSVYGYTHSKVKHGRGHYAWKGYNTNAIEGFWGQFKRSVRGTYHFVSKKHLQAYLDEFAFRYNLRTSSVPVFEVLLQKI